MKIGIVANIFRDKSLCEALTIFKEKGLDTIEIGCGGYAGKTLADPYELLSDSSIYAPFPATEIPSIPIRKLPVCMIRICAMQSFLLRNLV